MTDLFGHEDVTPVAPKKRRNGQSPIVRMHGKFGRGPDGATCGGCDSLVTTGHNRRYFKCERYRISGSEATDFRKRWPACGLWRQRGDA